MKLAAVETNDRFLGCGAECLSAELRRLFCCTSERADFNPAALGSEQTHAGFWWVSAWSQ